jgi:hypothetical protein
MVIGGFARALAPPSGSTTDLRLVGQRTSGIPATTGKARLCPQCAQDRREQAGIVMTGLRGANIERQEEGQLEPV